MGEQKTILWSGIGPYHKTGYGVQAALFLAQLAALGYRVVFHRMGAGVEDDRRHPDFTDTWDGVPVIGGGIGDFGPPAPLEVRKAFGGAKPDLLLILKDAWVLNPRHYARYNTAVWCNIDCDPMGEPDLEFFRRSGAHPIAVSRFGVSVMRDAGLAPSYVPHGVNLGYWTPGDQGEARELLGLPADGTFIAGINAANLGKVPRKAFYEQFEAFAQFAKRLQPKALLLCHTDPGNPEGVDLRRLAHFTGLAQAPDRPTEGDLVRFGAHMNMRAGQMVTWYRSLDVLLNATMGEGFGVPVVEAAACGIPAIVTDCTALPEKISHQSGWVVPGQPFWNEAHGALWTVPHIGAITAKLAHAAAHRHDTNRAELVRAAAEPYGHEHVTAEHWKPVLERLTR